MTGPRRFWLVATLALALLSRTGLPSHAQPADESAEAMNARLAGATVNRVGPSYLYPDHATTPGVVNPHITQANIQQTICTRGWTATVRPPASYTGHLKQQLAAAQATDRSPAHYDEDHFISLELGGHPHDARNLSPERWGTPAQPPTSRGPFPSHLVGAKAKNTTENALNREVCRSEIGD